MDGDRIALDVDVGPGAAAFLSTQASTKVYRSQRGTSSELHARVSTEGLLAVIPDPVVCFAASRYRQVQSFDLSADSGLVLVDWVSSGRHASGERWAFDEYVARLRARVEGRLVLHDALALRGDDGDLRDRLGRFDVLAVLLILGTRLREHAADVAARRRGDAAHRRSTQLTAAAPVGIAGCVGARGRDVRRADGAHDPRVSRVPPGRCSGTIRGRGSGEITHASDPARNRQAGAPSSRRARAEAPRPRAPPELRRRRLRSSRRSCWSSFVTADPVAELMDLGRGCSAAPTCSTASRR